MTEDRKKTEIEYYDKKAKEWSREYSGENWSTDFEGFNPKTLSSFAFCYQLLKKYCPDKEVLDYGCGNGIHSIFPVKMGAKKVIGIDLSGKSLEIAKERAKKEGVEGKVDFLLMDCEKMNFPENSFDVILDTGTFSSLDLNQAYPELKRVLKPEGLLIGIETFGHNPLTNLKRKINKLRGKRTGWAAEHILNQKDLEKAKNYFNKIEVYYFHLISWVAFPFLKFFGGRVFLRFLEETDKLLLYIFPFLKKYCFKIVFIMS